MCVCTSDILKNENKSIEQKIENDYHKLRVSSHDKFVHSKLLKIPENTEETSLK